jgi:hypothetical protein
LGLQDNIGNPEFIVEVVSTVIDDHLTHLFTEQSNLYHIPNSQQWKVSSKSLKWYDITPEEMKTFVGLTILMGQVRKYNMRDHWSADPTISTPIFPNTMRRN